MRGSVFVVTLCLLLTATVDGKSSKKKRRKNNDVYERRRACQTAVCGHLVPLEAMNCVNECVSPDCYRKTYPEPLEDGEVNKQLATIFLACARKEMNASNRSQKRSERSSPRKPSAAATAAAAAVDQDAPPRGEERESPAVLKDGSEAAEQNEIVGVDSDDGDVTDGDAEEGDWDDGFEESSDEELGLGLEGEEQQDVADQVMSALR